MLPHRHLRAWPRVLKQLRCNTALASRVSHCCVCPVIAQTCLESTCGKQREISSTLDGLQRICSVLALRTTTRGEVLQHHWGGMDRHLRERHCILGDEARATWQMRHAVAPAGSLAPLAVSFSLRPPPASSPFNSSHIAIGAPGRLGTSEASHS